MSVVVGVDVVMVSGLAINTSIGLAYYLVNKPAGTVTTASDTHGRPTVVDLVPSSPRVFPVGRLDMDSEGLLLLTNDGLLAQLLTHPRHGVEKEYLVKVVAPSSGVPAPIVQQLRRGVRLDDGPTRPADVRQPQAGVLKFVLKEGRNRQIRRMCDAVGYPVERLVRTRIGPVKDSRLSPGSYRTLTLGEVKALREAARATDTIHDT